jgi:hypothetical protein
VQPALKDRPDRQALLVQLAHKALKEFKAILDLQGLKVTTDLLVLKVQLGQQVRKVYRAMSDLPAHKDPRVLPVHKVKLEILVLREILDPLALKV